MKDFADSKTSTASSRQTLPGAFDMRTTSRSRVQLRQLLTEREGEAYFSLVPHVVQLAPSPAMVFRAVLAAGHQRKVRVSQPGDSFEQEADRVADSVTRMAVPGAPQMIPAPQGLSGAGGQPLSSAEKTYFEPRFGRDLSAVRVHSDTSAAQAAREHNAQAFTYGSNIYFGACKHQPQSEAGRHLLAHELAHVVQQGGLLNQATHPNLTGPSGSVRLQGNSVQPYVARVESDEDPDAKLSLGSLDQPLVTATLSEALGPTLWTVMREFLRGLMGGLLSASPEQVAGIQEKLAETTVKDQLAFTLGSAMGLFKGLGTGLKDTVDAFIALIKLPYHIIEFLSGIPELVVRYAVQLQELLNEGGELASELTAVLVEFAKDPKAALVALTPLLESLGEMVLAQVRAYGRTTAKSILDFLSEPWFEFGVDIGTVLGLVLFQVVLALGTEAIGNMIKEVGSLAASFSTRVVKGAAWIFRTLRGLIGKSVEWLAGAGERIAGKIGTLFKRLRALLGRFLQIIEKLAQDFEAIFESMGETTVGGQMPFPTKDIATSSQAKKVYKSDSAHSSNLSKDSAINTKITEEIPSGHTTKFSSNTTRRPSGKIDPIYCRGPKLSWEPNPIGTATRTEEEAVKIAVKAAEEGNIAILDPNDIHFKKYKFKNSTKKTWAQYFQSRGNNLDDIVEWDTLINKDLEQIVVSVSKDVFDSDEAIAAVLGHEMHELHLLHQAFVERGGRMTYRTLGSLINEDIVGNLHAQAWYAADKLVQAMRAKKA